MAVDRNESFDHQLTGGDDDVDAPAWLAPSQVAIAAPMSLAPPVGSAAAEQLASPAIEVLAADIERLEPRVRTFLARHASSHFNRASELDLETSAATDLRRSAVVIAVRRVTRAALTESTNIPRRPLVEAALWAIQIHASAGHRRSATSLIGTVTALIDISEAAGEPLTIGDPTQDELEALLGTTDPAVAESSATTIPIDASDSAATSSTPTIDDFAELVNSGNVRGAADAARARQALDVQIALRAIDDQILDDWRHPDIAVLGAFCEEHRKVLRLMTDGDFDEAAVSLRNLVARFDLDLSPTPEAAAESPNPVTPADTDALSTVVSGSSSTAPSPLSRTTLESFLADAMLRSGDVAGAADLWQKHVDRGTFYATTLWNLVRHHAVNNDLDGALDLVGAAFRRSDLSLDLVHFAAAAALRTMAADRPSPHSIEFLTRHGAFVCNAAIQRVRLSLMPASTPTNELLGVARRASSLVGHPPLPASVANEPHDHGHDGAIAVASRSFDETLDGRTAFRLWLNAYRQSHPLDPAGVLAIAEFERAASREGRARGVLRAAIERIERAAQSQGRSTSDAEAAFIAAIRASGPLEPLAKAPRSESCDDTTNRALGDVSDGPVAERADPTVGPATPGISDERSSVPTTSAAQLTPTPRIASTETQTSPRAEPNVPTTPTSRPVRTSPNDSAPRDRDAEQPARKRRVAPPGRRVGSSGSSTGRDDGRKPVEGSGAAHQPSFSVRSQRLFMRRAFVGPTPITFPRRERPDYTIEVHPGRGLVIELRTWAMSNAAADATSVGRVGLFVDVENIAGRLSSFDSVRSRMRRLHRFASTLGTLECAVAVMSPWTIGASWTGANDVAHAEGFEVIAPPIEIGESGNEDTRRNAADFAMLATMERQVRDLGLDTVVVCSGDAAFYQFVKTHITERGDAVVVGSPGSRSDLFDKLARSSRVERDLPGRCEVRSLDDLTAKSVSPARPDDAPELNQAS